MLFALFATPVAQAQTQALWDDSAIGMSVEQVKQRFPDAVVPAAPDRLHSGATERLQVPEVMLAGHRFQASFFFIGEHLAQVTLGLVDAEVGSVASQAFDAVSRMLRKEHGPEHTLEQTTGLVTRSEASWHVGSTRILLLHMVIGRADPLLNLVYQELPTDP